MPSICQRRIIRWTTAVLGGTGLIYAAQDFWCTRSTETVRWGLNGWCCGDATPRTAEYCGPSSVFECARKPTNLKERFLAYAHWDEVAGEFALSPDEMVCCLLLFRRDVSAEAVPPVSRRLLHMLFHHVDWDSSGTLNYADCVLLLTLLMTPVPVWLRGFDLLDPTGAGEALSASQFAELLHAVMVDDARHVFTNSCGRNKERIAPGMLAQLRRHFLAPTGVAHQPAVCVDPEQLVLRISNPEPSIVAELQDLEHKLAAASPVNLPKAHMGSRLRRSWRWFRRWMTSSRSAVPLASGVAEGGSTSMVWRDEVTAHVQFLTRIVRAAVFTFLDGEGSGLVSLSRFQEFLCRDGSPSVRGERRLSWDEFLFMTDALGHMDSVLQVARTAMRMTRGATDGCEEVIHREGFIEAVRVCMHDNRPPQWRQVANDVFDLATPKDGAARASTLQRVALRYRCLFMSAPQRLQGRRDAHLSSTRLRSFFQCLLENPDQSTSGAAERIHKH